MAGLLFDENLSIRLISLLGASFPDSVHVVEARLSRTNDATVWQYARTHGLVIVSKDSDFNELSATRGQPPKVIWLRIGNRSTEQTSDILRRNAGRIHAFIEAVDEALLVVDD